MKYKVGEDGEIWYGVGFDEDMKEFCGKELVIRYVGDVGYLCHGNNRSWQDWMFEGVVEKQIDHESVILQLTELNALKTRQLDELMKFIAHLVPKAHKEYLSHHLNDVQLIDGIMYHVRKGK